MTEFLLILIGIVVFIGLELAVLYGLYRVGHASARKRELEFARLDAERQELIKLQESLLADGAAAKTIVQEGIAKLNQIGAESHSEWTEMTNKIDEVMAEIEQRSSALIDETLQTLNKKALEARKLVQVAQDSCAELQESIRAAKKVAKFFDSQVHVDDLINDLQMEKYKEARAMLLRGADSQAVSAKLGLSLSEVTLVSHMIS